MHFTTDAHPNLTAAELRSRCTAAARLSLRGMGYTPEDRAECAAEIMARVLAKHGGSFTADAVLERPTGHPCTDRAERAAMLRNLDSALKRHPSYWDFLRTRGDVAIPRERVAFSYLTGLAANFRRALDAERERDADTAAERAATDGFTPRVMEDGPSEIVTTPERAHRAALDILPALGLTGHYGAYLHAYCAARLTGAAMLGADLPLAAVAAELGWDGATAAKTLGMAMTRGRKSIPSVAALPVAAHLDAVHLLDTGGVAMKPTRSRNQAADLAPRERYSDGVTRAVNVTTDKTCKRDGRKRYPLPDWTRDLAPATALRLQRAADLRRAHRKTTEHGMRASIAAERGASIPALPSAS